VSAPVDRDQLRALWALRRAFGADQVEVVAEDEQINQEGGADK
jgi:hypothetical protein